MKTNLLRVARFYKRQARKFSPNGENILTFMGVIFYSNEEQLYFKKQIFL